MRKSRKRKKKQLNSDLIRNSLLRIVVFLLFIGLNWVGLSAVVETFGYFNDTETAEENILIIGTLDFSLDSENDFSPEVTPTVTSSRDISVVNDGSLDFQYKVKINNLSGDFCQNLNLKATLNSIILYDGNLAGFNIATTTDLGTLNFVASSNAHGFNQACDFNLIFTGWQVNLDNENLGFSDEESISSSIVGGQDDVVLNEFLPNPIGEDTQDGILGEWVEFYNNSDHAIDMTGWYTEDAVGASHRRTISAATTYNGQTTIGAKGSGSEWLVLFMNGNILNNDIDTINLYDNYGGLVDTYIYSGSDYNVNDTPGSTNNLVAYLPFNNDLLDKSGNNNNGTNYGTTFSAGKIEQGLTLSSSKYVEIPDSPSLDITDKITLEAWVYPTAWNNSNENSILTKAGDGEYGVWNLHYKTTANGFRFELNNGATQTLFETTPSTALSVWYHVVGVYNGSEMKLYVNGVLKGSLATSGNIATNNSPLRIGKQFWWGSTYSYWTGKIDEVKVYNRALSATEVLEHFNTVNNGVTNIPENKSFARIPDGYGAWVDPIPTPGGPNKLETEEIEEIQDIKDEDNNVTTTPEIIIIGDETNNSTSTEEVINDENATTTPEIIPTVIEETPNTEEETEEETAEQFCDSVCDLDEGLVVEDPTGENPGENITDGEETAAVPPTENPGENSDEQLNPSEPVIEPEPVMLPEEIIITAPEPEPEPIVESTPEPTPAPEPAPEPPPTE